MSEFYKELDESGVNTPQFAVLGNEIFSGRKNSGELLAESAGFEGGMGAVAWAVLEMFKRGGMDEGALRHLQDQMMTYFARPSSDDCNDILKVVERRLELDRLQNQDRWY